MFSRLSVFLAPVLLCAAAPALAAGFDDCPQFFSGKPPNTNAYGQLRQICLNEFAVLHSGQTKTPIFVAQRLNAHMLEQAKDLKRRDKFYPESRLPSADRAQLSDYKNSGLSRGHMAAAGDMSTKDGKAQSYSLANMVPQNPQNNSGPWARIEQDTRRYALRAQGDVFVITGPVFEPDSARIGSRGVRVPAYLYKLVYDAHTGKAWAHWQRNQAGERVSAPIPYEELVRRTGIDFLGRRSD
jgi:endonuclease G